MPRSFIVMATEITALHASNVFFVFDGDDSETVKEVGVRETHGLF